MLLEGSAEQEKHENRNNKLLQADNHVTEVIQKTFDVGGIEEKSDENILDD